MENKSADNILNKWGFAFILSLPALLFFLSHFLNHSKDVAATGFIQYDNVSYVGNAQQYLNSKDFSIFYSNRLNESPDYSKIYFQPQHLVLALLMKSGISPGMSLCIFNYLFFILFFVVLISLYDYLFPYSTNRKLILLLFAWGGGIFALSGWLLYFTGMAGDHNFLNTAFIADPANGWWGLNLGRSLFFSMEVYYHTIFFASVCFIVKKKWLSALAMTILLSISHPFTGIELLLILLVWALIEKVFYRNESVPVYLIIALALITLFHLWYYLFWLPGFPEHRSVYEQYQLNWKLRFYHFIPAYILVVITTLISIKHAGQIKEFIANENNRLFITWALLTFLLANHEIFIKPMQPAHFTRGYIWSALFLAGIPGLNIVLNRLKKAPPGKPILFLFVLLFLLDNATWIYANSRYTAYKNHVSYIDKEQNDILDFLKRSTTDKTLIIGSDMSIPYLSTVYTNANVWISHAYNTPFYSEKLSRYTDYIDDGSLPAAWKGRDLLFVAEKKSKKQMSRYMHAGNMATKSYESENYLLYRLK